VNHFAIVSGSHRNPSQTCKVARFVQRLIESELDGADTWLLDLAVAQLPLWNPGVCESADSWDRTWGPVSAALHESTALVIVTPEWGGMVPAAVKNLFLLCEQHHELSHKPGLIVSVSSGMGGSYPVAELRMSSYKNTRFCYIPEHVIVRSVRNVLNDPDLPLERASAEEACVRRRLSYAVRLLEVYADALKIVRGSGAVDLTAYPFGM
jgi:NAD(P)H-dependent FMN reductase